MEAPASYTYLLQVRRRETVHAQHHGRATDEGCRDQDDVIVDLLDGAENEADNGACCISLHHQPKSRAKDRIAVD